MQYEAGDTMFSVGQTPFHGTLLDNPPTTAEAMKLAGMDWDVQLRPLYMPLMATLVPEDAPAIGDAAGDMALERIAQNATVRSDTGAVLGYVSPGYHPVQNSTAFGFFDRFIEQGKASLEAAGCFKGGKRVWVLAKTNVEPIEIVKNDPVMSYLLLSNGHDGCLAVRVGFTAIRGWCSNMIALMMNKANSKLLRVRHTKNAEVALATIQDIMDLQAQEFVATTDQLKTLARCKVGQAQVEEYVRKVFAPKVLKQDTAEDAENKADDCSRLVANIVPLFEEGRGQHLPEVKGTMWAAYNSITEYLTHERGRSQDTRMDSVWFGDSHKVAQRALKIGHQMAMMA